MHELSLSGKKDLLNKENYDYTERLRLNNLS